LTDWVYYKRRWEVTSQWAGLSWKEEIHTTCIRHPEGGNGGRGHYRGWSFEEEEPVHLTPIPPSIWGKKRQKGGGGSNWGGRIRRGQHETKILQLISVEQ